mgnify:CR=1 FL=1
MSKIEVNTIEPQCGTTLTVGASGDTITFPTGTTIVNNGTQTGFGRTGTVDWDTTIKTSTITAVSGEGYFVNTSGGAITANLPAGVVGAIVSFKDYAQTFDTNALTISANGSEKIEGQTYDLILGTEGQATTLVYGDATKGWQSVNSNEITNIQRFVTATGGTITTVCTNYKVHTFTGPGTFEVTCAGSPAGSSTVSYMVVAGGGGGGHDDGGGGGAGGYRESRASDDSYTASPLNATSGPTYNLSVAASSFPITVGAGGTGGIPPCNGLQGSSSIFSTITSAGGGFGGRSVPTGGPGGSGGGGGDGVPGGTGNTPPVSPAQGNNGGTGGTANAAAGGGGAGAVGGNGIPSPSGGGAGGAGVTTEINASSVTRSGGGGGGGFCAPGAGGAGGGGSGGVYPTTQATAGTTNTGGGGGGGSTNTGPRDGKNGGSGIVIIRYKFQ